MSVIAKPNKDPLNPTGNINLPAMEVPSFRFLLAQERRTVKNVLIMTPYALGDCVCAEPAIRYAINNFKGCSISLLTPFPEIFQHLPLAKVINTKDAKPKWDDYYVLKCYYAADELQSEFTHNFNMAIGDYIATCLFKGQLPTEFRNITLEPKTEDTIIGAQVVIHAGKHWVSKTFPKAYWDEIIRGLIAEGVKPVLVGASVDDGKRGFVDVNAVGCIDYRDKLSIMKSVSVLQNAKVVLTNDSAPFHIAASGTAWIGFFSTVRHKDFTQHWRPHRYADGTEKNEFGYKQHDFALGRMWQDGDVSPLRNGSKYDVIDAKTLRSWLPDPKTVIEWTMSKLANGSH